jgi:hypothetical protein
VHVAVDEAPPEGWELESGGVRRRVHGETLAAVMERLGGESGDVVDPWGGTHRLDLSSWRGHDPDQTYVHVCFRWRHAGLPPPLWNTVYPFATSSEVEGSGPR